MRVQYSTESLRALIENPTDRSQAVRTAIESVNGKLINFFGIGGGIDQGAMVIYEVPDHTAQQAFSNAILASGAVTTCAVNRLYTPEETLAGWRKAQTVQKAYEAPAARR
jgi:uncharacterized protein with GYD domain